MEKTKLEMVVGVFVLIGMVPERTATRAGFVPTRKSGAFLLALPRFLGRWFALSQPFDGSRC